MARALGQITTQQTPTTGRALGQIQQASSQKRGFRFDEKPLGLSFGQAQQKASSAQETSREASSPLGFAKNFAKSFVETIAPAEVGLGKTLSGIFGGKGASQAESTKTLADSQAQLLRDIKQREAEGKDVTQLKQVYNTNAGQLESLVEKTKTAGELPTTKQAVGQLGGTALDLLTFGTYGKAAQSLRTALLGSARPSVIPTGATGFFTKQTAKEALTGGLVGYGFDVTMGLQEDEPTGEALTPGIGTAIGTGIPLLGRGGSAIQKARADKRVALAEKEAKKVDDTIAQIIQGKKDDIDTARKALTDIDANDIKTYEDLTDALVAKEGGLARSLDDALATQDDKLYKLSELTQSTKVGKNVVEQNYVDDAFKHLEELYINTGELAEAEAVRLARQKATQQGLNVREINNLARLYGDEFGTKAFSKVSGDPLTSHSAQAFENTRKGIKTTARELFDNPVYEQADLAMSNIINTKKLTQRMEEQVNKLQQRIKNRSLGEKVGRLAFEVIDLLTGKFFSGFLRSALVPRGGGLKTLNAIDLEKELQKNLKLLNSALKDDASEKQIEKALNEIIQGSKKAQELTELPANQSTKSTTKIVPTIDIPPTVPQKTTLRKLTGGKPKNTAKTKDQYASLRKDLLKGEILVRDKKGNIGAIDVDDFDATVYEKL